jgi:hypothetical protein
MSEIFFVGSREVREVPKGWQHPKDERGRYIPLPPVGYRFDEGQGPYPTMPDPGDDPDVMAYETVSEGTPISPAFAQSRDLVLYCAEHCTTFGDHKAGVEAWAAILFGDAAIGLDGQVIAND